MIRGLKGEVVCGMGEIVTRPCCHRSRCGTTFQCTNGEMENGYCSQHVLAIFSRYCGQRTMTITGAKRKVPHLMQAQQAPICLRSISETLLCQKFRGIVTICSVYYLYICSAVFTLAINRPLIQASAILVSQSEFYGPR